MIAGSDQGSYWNRPLHWKPFQSFQSFKYRSVRQLKETGVRGPERRCATWRVPNPDEPPCRLSRNVARSRILTQPRSLLVYLARHWSGMTSKELGLRLRRDGSMISRLYTTYVEQRDPRVEARILRLLTNKSITRSDPSRRPSQFK
jgi:hypothetical protein